MWARQRAAGVSGQQLLDLAPAFAGCGREQLPLVVVIQVRGEEAHCGEVRAPSPSMSRMAGNLLAARAASMRL
ncbi:MAG: hypothetical protein DMF80_07950 [Acidobacteria bacterium]|nr:MAG: hypothetical protein DMF80_07950 [Acidobacteriota bacterium]